MLLSLQDRPYGRPSEQSPQGKPRPEKTQADDKAQPFPDALVETPACALTLSPDALRLLGRSVH